MRRERTARRIARETLGVPLLPPASASTATNRVREALGGLRDAMAPPPVRILEGLFGALDHRVLVAICAAGVPDALTRPVAFAHLAEWLGADPARLERLRRFAAARGWVRIDRRGRVRPTRVTAFLREDHPGGWRAWVDFAGGGEVVAAVGALSADKTATDGFASVNGMSFFEWMAHHPERWATFDAAMAAGGRMHGLALASALDWSGARKVCDVGGGTGALLAVLLDLVPHLEGTVFDLPDVVARAVTHERLDTQGGDVFERAPPGFDTFLLVNVLHDWDDSEAQRILSQVAAAAGDDARVIAVGSEPVTRPRDDLAIRADVLMAALTNGGRERTTAEFADLGRACGLRLVHTVRLATGDVAHEYR